MSLFGLSALQTPHQQEEWVWTLSSAKAWQVGDVAAVIFFKDHNDSWQGEYLYEYKVKT